MAPRAGAAVAALLASLILAACGPDDFSDDERKIIRSLSLAELSPLPDDPSNRFADDPPAAAFGKTLFFDAGLSGGGDISCATCHKAERQFQDHLPRGVGVARTDRRTMPLAGVGWSPFLFWDGRRDSFWAQALAPLEDPREHAGNRTAFAHHVADAHGDRYGAIFGPLPPLAHLPAEAGPKGSPAQQAAWQAMSEEDRRAVDRVFANIGKALAAFERTIHPPRTRFDLFAEAVGKGEEPAGIAAFTPLEREGLRLFIGKANCLECHNGPRLTDDHFHNTGVPALAGAPPDRGRAGAVAELAADPFNCFGTFSDAPAAACTALRFMRSDDPAMERAYKTPSLRGAASRPPYMHAGQIATLDAVIDHYSRAPDAPSGTSELRGVVFTERGRKALIAFLKTLDPIP
ncbi:cytochrome-c peroxidase [Nitratireductor pacificus]|uniref:Methylamine utilization protein n=1 Tax=Nitratireductor pacificus pht-3B TaxID=391937 RepID=K2N694_9HYPH|nr:cytochrome c peroxidase [Nitratireductor pacificus]EKF19638.1 methylamine utilization protein [Nitratireductor pacificus pht-3B]